MITCCLHRRAFLAALGAALVFRPVGALGQATAKPPRIGWLTSSVLHTRNVEAFRQEMQALGHRDLSLEIRAAEGKMDRLPSLAAELVAIPLDVIVTDGGPALVAAKRATSTIPIVIGAAAIDLVQQGVVASLARPGGNVTGFLISTGAELDGKRLELLREALPSLARVAVVWNPRNDANPHKLASLEAPARALGVQLESVQARDVQDIDRALGGGARRRVDAMLALARRLPVEPARAHRGGGGPTPAARDVRGAGVQRVGGPDGVRAFRGRQLPPRRGVRRPHPQRGEAGGPADRAAGQARLDDQPQDRPRARPDGPAVAPRAGGAHHRVIGRFRGNVADLFPPGLAGSLGDP